MTNLFPALAPAPTPRTTAPFRFDHTDACTYRPDPEGSALSAHMFETRGGAWKWIAKWTWAEYDLVGETFYDKSKEQTGEAVSRPLALIACVEWMRRGLCSGCNVSVLVGGYYSNDECAACVGKKASERAK